MAKLKTTDTGSRPPQQPEQPAQSERQTLDVQLAELSAEISGIETEIQRTTGIIKAAPGRIAQAKADYDAAFLRSDTAGMTAAQDRIRAANEERAAAVAKLSDFAKPLEELRDRQTTLRLRALDAVKATGDELERARRAAQQAGMQLDVVSQMGSKLTGVVATLPHRPVTSEPSAVEPSESEPPAKPSCPRCRRSDEVQEVTPGRFVCRAGYHGALSFDVAGEIVGGFSPAISEDRHGARSRRQYDPPLDDGPRKGVGHGPRDSVTIMV